MYSHDHALCECIGACVHVYCMYVSMHSFSDKPNFAYYYYIHVHVRHVYFVSYDILSCAGSGISPDKENHSEGTNPIIPNGHCHRVTDGSWHGCKTWFNINDVIIAFKGTIWVVFTISLRHEPSPTRTLKWPTRNRVQIMCNILSAYHVCLLVGCLTSQQHASVSQGRICTDNFYVLLIMYNMLCYVPRDTKGQLSY